MPASVETKGAPSPAVRIAPAITSELALRYFDKFDIIVQERFRQLELERRHWNALGFANAKGDRQPT